MWIEWRQRWSRPRRCVERGVKQQEWFRGRPRRLTLDRVSTVGLPSVEMPSAQHPTISILTRVYDNDISGFLRETGAALALEGLFLEGNGSTVALKWEEFTDPPTS